MTFNEWWKSADANEAAEGGDQRGLAKAAWDAAVAAERGRLADLVLYIPDPPDDMPPRDAQTVALEAYRKAIREGK